MRSSSKTAEICLPLQQALLQAARQRRCQSLRHVSSRSARLCLQLALLASQSAQQCWGTLCNCRRLSSAKQIRRRAPAQHLQEAVLHRAYQSKGRLQPWTLMVRARKVLSRLPPQRPLSPRLSHHRGLKLRKIGQEFQHQQL